jgi:hypothetical protein
VIGLSENRKRFHLYISFTILLCVPEFHCQPSCWWFLSIPLPVVWLRHERNGYRYRRRHVLLYTVPFHPGDSHSLEDWHIQEPKDLKGVRWKITVTCSCPSSVGSSPSIFIITLNWTTPSLNLVEREQQQSLNGLCSFDSLTRPYSLMDLAKVMVSSI